VPESTVTAAALLEALYDIEPDALDRHEHHLRDTLPGLHDERVAATIPARHEYLTLVVGIDQANQIPQHDPMLMSEPGAGEQDRGKVRRAYMYGDTRRDQVSAPRLDTQRLIHASPQVDACGTLCSIVR
jgi:hypothetical protein